MISFLQGVVQNKELRALTLNVNSVGYRVHATSNFLEKTGEGEKCELFIHTHVREDDISLYGFASREEWELFKLLLTVSGIGPRSALEILNAPLGRVRQAIAKKDSAFLTRIPGIGKKTAERIIVDLEGKIKENLLEEKLQTHGERDDIIEALVSLGYQRKQVVSGLKKIPAEIEGDEEIIKYFLQNI